MSSLMKKSQSIPGGGIERVMQKDKKKMGQPGKMNQKPDEKADWKRGGDKLTPRKA